MPGTGPASLVDLNGKVALVTGASGAIGGATARLLAAAGAAVIGVDLPGRASAVGRTMPCDLSDPAAVRELMAGIAREPAGVDILVHAAGIARDRVLWKLTDQDWSDVIRVNLDAAFWILRETAPLMRRAGGGSIVLVTSINGERGKFGQANYAAAKAGIAAMTIVLARELERAGVRVNAIAPVALTRLTEDLMGGQADEAAKASLDPTNVAAAVGWLASDLSDGVSGQVVKIQGGICQIVQGWRPITEITSDKPWTIESINAGRDQLFAKSEPGIPPFLLKLPG